MPKGGFAKNSCSVSFLFLHNLQKATSWSWTNNSTYTQNNNQIIAAFRCCFFICARTGECLFVNARYLLPFLNFALICTQFCRIVVFASTYMLRVCVSLFRSQVFLFFLIPHFAKDIFSKSFHSQFNRNFAHVFASLQCCYLHKPNRFISFRF